MANRIDERFNALRGAGKSGLVTYIGAGDPHLQATVDIAVEFDRIGVDVLELGLPFSDPLADGIVNQLAAARALASGATTAGVLEAVRQIRQRAQIPIVLYTYMNPIYRYGFAKFVEDAEAAGVDGLLILDLPPDEDENNPDLQVTSGMRRIRLIAPTTPEPRISRLVKNASGFIYYVSREGVTGERSDIADTMPDRVSMIREKTALPIAVGFGISTPAQVAQVAGCADAVVVGSAIVRRIAEQGSEHNLARRIGEFVSPLVAAAHREG
jgi:tryptophan synthase alpha chain